MTTDDKKGLKEFGLTTLSVKNTTTVLVLTAILAIVGIVSYQKMPAEAFPEIILPQVYVGTAYPGNAPLEIEKLITRPIEKELKSITGIDKLTSTSTPGYSAIDIQFDFSVSPKEALRKVKDAVDKVKADPSFPKDLPMEPNIFEMNFSELTPVMNVNLSGDFSSEILKNYAEILEDKLEAIPQISAVDIRGIQEKEVKINLDLYRMESMEISFQDVEQAIAYNNMSISGGDLVVAGIRRNVKVEGEFTDWKDIENTIIKQEKLNIVYLRDIAEVVFEEKESESYAREYGAPVVMLDVKKRGGENLIEASNSIHEAIDELKKTTFPDNLKITITSDQSEQTKTSVSELENNIIFGTFLVVLVLLFFLGLRNAAFVGIAIPLSMGIAMFILNLMGVTLNMMVLFSLVLALGMLVDNGIVVIENVTRLRDEGYSLKDAAIYGTGEIAWPIISSTATTLAAFVPLMLWPGIMGEFMKFLPITLMIVLGSSLFVALVVNPVLFGVLTKMSKKGVRNLAFVIAGLGLLITLSGSAGMGNMLIFVGIFILINPKVVAPISNKFQTKFLPYLENVYGKIMATALNYSKTFFFGTIGLLILSFVLLSVFPPPTVFFPANQPAYINVFIDQPIGTDIEQTNEIARKVEKEIMDFFNEEITLSNGNKERRGFLVSSIIGQVGNGTSDPAAGPSFGSTPEKARVQISFEPFHKRKGIATGDIMNELRKRLKGTPGVYLTVDKNSDGPPMGKPINIEISGEDYDALIAESEKMTQFIKAQNIPGIEELKMDIQVDKPELEIVVDKQKAQRLNISAAQIGTTIRTALFGKEISKYKQGEDEYDITVRLKENTRNQVENLLNQRITFRDMLTGQIVQVPISSIADIKNEVGISAVKRKKLKRLISLQSNVLEGYNANEVVDAIKTSLKGYEVSKEVSVKFTGQQEEQEKEMSFLGSALMAAVFLIFLIIVAQFNSISAPLIIVGSIVLSLIGVLLGLVATGMEFVIIMTMIGIISLAGIVVNNAIVLLDYTKLILHRKELELGLDGEGKNKAPFKYVFPAIVEGGKTRLRPVLLTAITTVLGLLPLAIGLNIDFFSLFSTGDPLMYVGGDNVIFWGPMSWTIIFGLTFATFLTLVIVPVMFYIALKIKYKLYKID